MSSWLVFGTIATLLGVAATEPLTRWLGGRRSTYIWLQLINAVSCGLLLFASPSNYALIFGTQIIGSFLNRAPEPADLGDVRRHGRLRRVALRPPLYGPDPLRGHLLAEDGLDRRRRGRRMAAGLLRLRHEPQSQSTATLNGIRIDDELAARGGQHHHRNRGAVLQSRQAHTAAHRSRAERAAGRAPGSHGIVTVEQA